MQTLVSCISPSQARLPLCLPLLDFGSARALLDLLIKSFGDIGRFPWDVRDRAELTYAGIEPIDSHTLSHLVQNLIDVYAV
jgi:hypothetical protein